MRVAYADPPYPGQAKRHYGDHPDYGGEVDHGALIRRLEDEFDGWALSTSEQALQEILALCPRKQPGAKGRRYRSFSGVRVIVWCKRSGPPFPNEGTHGFEPVIVRGARAPAPGLRDWLVCEPERYTFRPRPPWSVTGEKPKPFIEWMFAWVGLDRTDEFVDLFPGSGAVGRTWDAWRSQLSLAEASA